MSDEANAFELDCAWLDARQSDVTEAQYDEFSDWVTRLYNEGDKEDDAREKVFSWMFLV